MEDVERILDDALFWGSLNLAAFGGWVRSLPDEALSDELEEISKNLALIEQRLVVSGSVAIRARRRYN